MITKLDYMKHCQEHSALVAMTLFSVPVSAKVVLSQDIVQVAVSARFLLLFRVE
jgi:hypothetical protein